MAGHSKWEQIKRAKGVADSKRSKLFSKYGRLLSLASKKCSGDINSPELRTIIEKAKKENMPKDNIERAIKKGTSVNQNELESLVYEAYGQGGAALIIDALTDNRNKAAQEVKHILSKNGASLAVSGSALWAFEKTGEDYIAKSEIELNKEDSESLIKLMEELEDNDEVQNVYTNAILVN